MDRFIGPPLTSIPIQSTLPMSAFSQMPMHTPMMFPGAGIGGPMLGGGGFAQGMAGMSSAGAGRAGGGLLARLFGFGGGTKAASGGLASGLGKAAGSSIKFSTILDNSQRVLGLTQQVMPMVRQYGPIIRNLPAMWRIMRSSDSELAAFANQVAGPTVDLSSLMNENLTTPTTTEGYIENNTLTETVAPLPSQLLATPSQETNVNTEATKPRFSNTTKEGIPLPKLYV
ncbi:VrrA/YqfQ family protein [Alkalihalobacillus sp. 1P02AB]|uniref:VrrA/YqfQ family protein n=1 Tax=Alkalihalobacillus sp. 1P02AB TaxID=3132260 RepID=UPI0039A6BAAB